MVGQAGSTLDKNKNKKSMKWWYRADPSSKPGVVMRTGLWKENEIVWKVPTPTFHSKLSTGKKSSWAQLCVQTKSAWKSKSTTLWNYPSKPSTGRGLRQGGEARRTGFWKEDKKGENHQLQHLILSTGKSSGRAQMKIKINNSIGKSFQARSVEDNWAQVWIKMKKKLYKS